MNSTLVKRERTVSAREVPLALTPTDVIPVMLDSVVSIIQTHSDDGIVHIYTESDE